MNNLSNILVVLFPMISQKIAEGIMSPFNSGIQIVKVKYVEQIMLLIILYILTYSLYYFNNYFISNRKSQEPEIFFKIRGSIHEKTDKEINSLDKKEIRNDINKKTIVTMIPFFVWFLMYIFPTTSKFMDKYGMSIITIVIFTILYYYSYNKIN